MIFEIILVEIIRIEENILNILKYINFIQFFNLIPRLIFMI